MDRSSCNAKHGGIYGCRYHCQRVVTRFGVPTTIHSAEGSQFESGFKEMCQLLQINKTKTTPYHPKSDGMVEHLI